MLGRIINFIFGVKEIEDPNDAYPDIIPDLSLEEIMRRLDIEDDEDDTANFYLIEGLDNYGGEG